MEDMNKALEEQLSPEVKEKIAKVAADTIMGDLNAMANEDSDKMLQQLQEAQAENAKQDPNSSLNEIAQNYLRVRPRPKQLVRDYKKIGRNDPCPCGSGEKYKNCCMSSGRFETLHEVK
jgi:uncharacterized protein YecA (UPF0149 family)